MQLIYELIEATGGSAEQLFQAISRVFEKDSISFDMLIGFAADTTNVMFGKNNSVVSRLKQRVPDSCHSVHLCASHSCEKLPHTVEELIHDIYNYFAHSAKRQAEFKQFQCLNLIVFCVHLRPVDNYYTHVSQGSLNNGMRSLASSKLL